MRSLVLVVCLLMTAASTAAAQDTYVGAALVGDIARFSRVELESVSPLVQAAGVSADGEALGFHVTIGRALGDRWGVEVEYARSGEINDVRSHRISPLELTRTPGLTIPIPFPIPEFELSFESEQQHTTYMAAMWVRQSVGDRVDLQYVGGVAFNRSELERETRFGDTLLRIISPFATSTTAIEYSAGPLVGMDASVGLGEHAALVTGLRVHTVTASARGWLIRPRVGLRWTF